jgi:endoglucanase
MPARRSNTLRLLGILGVPILLLGATAAGVLALRSAPGAVRAATSGPPAGLRVQGNQLVDGNGTPLRLIGMNRSGSEYACIQGWGVFDGPSDDASVQAMAAWHINSVRVPLNEDCWLGINGVPAADAGAAYQQAIVNYVNLLHQHGLYAEISLMWSAPGTTKASYQREMPDTDHTPAMWQSVAATFKNDPNVVFGVYGEPHGVDWPCWRDGGASCGLGWSVAGMQSLVDAVRSTGATQPIAVPGIDYANNLSQWLQYKPHDPLNSLVAEFHEYGDNTCHDAGCWNTQLLAVAQQAPLLTGELGESVNGTCAHSFLDTYMTWADAHGVSYQGWTWDTWGGCGVLITNYSGTPTSGFGQGFQAHLAALGTGGGPLPPGPTPTSQPSPQPSPTSQPSPQPSPTSQPTPQPSPQPSPTPTQPPSGACDAPAISFGQQSASADSVAQGGTIGFITRFTASCATQGLVDFEVFTADGTKIWQTWRDNRPLTGESQSVRAIWKVPASWPVGGYYLSIGVFSPGWDTLWAWKHQAAIFQVTPAAAACASTPAIQFTGASVAPTTVARGAATRLSVTLQSSCAFTGLVDFEVYDAAGNLAYQTWLDRRWLTGQAQTFAVSWAVPANQAAGSYHLSLGVFSSAATGWSTLYGWDEAAAGFTIQ